MTAIATDEPAADRHDPHGIDLPAMLDRLGVRPGSLHPVDPAAVQRVVDAVAASPMAAHLDRRMPVDHDDILTAARRLALARQQQAHPTTALLTTWSAVLDGISDVHEVPRGDWHTTDGDGVYRRDTLLDEATDTWLIEGDIVVVRAGDTATVMVVTEADHEHPDRLGAVLRPVLGTPRADVVVTLAREARGELPRGSCDRLRSKIDDDAEVAAEFVAMGQADADPDARRRWAEAVVDAAREHDHSDLRRNLTVDDYYAAASRAAELAAQGVGDPTAIVRAASIVVASRSLGAAATLRLNPLDRDDKGAWQVEGGADGMDALLPGDVVLVDPGWGTGFYMTVVAGRGPDGVLLHSLEQDITRADVAALVQRLRDEGSG